MKDTTVGKVSIHQHRVKTTPEMDVSCLILCYLSDLESANLNFPYSSSFTKLHDEEGQHLNQLSSIPLFIFKYTAQLEVTARSARQHPSVVRRVLILMLHT